MAVKWVPTLMNNIADLLTRVLADWLKCRGSSPRLVAEVDGAEFPWKMTDIAEGPLPDESLKNCPPVDIRGGGISAWINLSERAASCAGWSASQVREASHAHNQVTEVPVRLHGLINAANRQAHECTGYCRWESTWKFLLDEWVQIRTS